MIEQQSGEQMAGAVPASVAEQSAILAERAAALARIRSKPKLRPYERNFLWISRVIIWIVMALTVVPVILVVIASLTPGSAFFTTSLWPSSISWEHFQNVLDPNKNDFLVWMRNTTIVCVVTGVLSVLLITSTAYAFSRFRFYGRKYGLMAMLLIQMFPAQMAFVALFYLLLWLGNHTNGVIGLNSLQGLILVFLGGGIPFNAWLFKGYVDGLPRDLEESAYVDGATRFQAFWKIILPLTRPMMAVIFIFQVIGIYNDFILVNFLTSDSQHYTVTVGLFSFISGQFTQNWPDFAAGALLASVPILVLFMVAQRWLVSGLAAGAVKG
jgi:arabinogalactan oligomer/maltooligosaccharide transport system permease protein